MSEVLVKDLLLLEEFNEEMRRGSHISGPFASDVVTELIIRFGMFPEVLEFKDGLRIRQVIFFKVVVDAC